MSEFDVPKLHKWADNIEHTLTEWAMDAVQEHYGVDDTDDLTEEQWQELRDWVDNKHDTPYDWIMIGFNNILNAWENENYDDD
jgi:hypothetical protein